MLSVALASLSAVEKKQEKHDKKLDELECQLARLENRLESRFKLPGVDPSTLDTKYMTFDEMRDEAFRLRELIDERDIPDKESILKRLRDAKDEWERWEKAYWERKYEINYTVQKYRRRERLEERHRRLGEREEKLCRWSLGTAIFHARSRFSEWERKRQWEEREREKDSPEEPPKN